MEVEVTWSVRHLAEKSSQNNFKLQFCDPALVVASYSEETGKLNRHKFAEALLDAVKIDCEFVRCPDEESGTESCYIYLEDISSAVMWSGYFVP